MDKKDFVTYPPGSDVRDIFKHANDLLAENGELPVDPFCTIEQVVEQLFREALEKAGSDELKHEACEALRAYIDALTKDMGLDVDIEITPQGAKLTPLRPDEEEEFKGLEFEFAALFHKLSMSQILQLAGGEASDKLKKMVAIGASLEAAQEKKDEKSFSKKLKDEQNKGGPKER